MADGTLRTYHIRSPARDRIPTERLEMLNGLTDQEGDTNVGPLKIYKDFDPIFQLLETRLRNTMTATDGSSDVLIQLDHYHIPVQVGYYACVFPPRVSSPRLCDLRSIVCCGQSSREEAIPIYCPSTSSAGRIVPGPVRNDLDKAAQLLHRVAGSPWFGGSRQGVPRTDSGVCDCLQ